MWKDLTMSQRAKVIQMAVKSGMRDLSQIRSFYDESIGSRRFGEGGNTNNSWTMEDEAGYRAWRESLPNNLRQTSDNIYDMRAAYKSGAQPQLYNDGYYHLPSRDPRTGMSLKRPLHPTHTLAAFVDGLMGYHPYMKDGREYTDTWEGNKRVLQLTSPEKPPIPFMFAEGGKIYIKPENRGKFTALKERTGHSATWFKEHGTPAQRKMATFALNARHWKHNLGGPLVEAPHSYQTGGGLKRKAGYKAGDKAGTDQCAAWSNGVLRANNYGVYGNAWNLTGVNPVFNGYEGIRRPSTYNKDSVEIYNHAATSNVFKNFDSRTLDKSRPYVVNMFYNGSPHQETAYNEGTGVVGTHTGLLTWEGDDKNGQWMVTHNIHDKIHQEPFLSLQSKQNKYGVTAISSPKKSLGLAIKNFFGY